jgi:hypothetical protein
MTKTVQPVEQEQNDVNPRQEQEVVFDEGFNPISMVTIVKKNQRYVGVAARDLNINDIAEKAGFMITPYRTNEPDKRAKLIASIMPVYPCSCNECKSMGPNIVIPSGNMLFIQFSKRPNLHVEFDSKNALIYLRAITQIKAGDELFVDYTNLYPQDEVSQEDMFMEPPINANV